MKTRNGGAVPVAGGEEGDKQSWECSLQEPHICSHKQNSATLGKATPTPASRPNPDCLGQMCSNLCSSRAKRKGKETRQSPCGTLGSSFTCKKEKTQEKPLCFHLTRSIQAAMGSAPSPPSHRWKGVRESLALSNS